MKCHNYKLGCFFTLLLILMTISYSIKVNMANKFLTAKKAGMSSNLLVNNKETGFIFNAIAGLFRTPEYWQLTCNNYFDIGYYYIPATSSSAHCDDTPIFLVNNVDDVKIDKSIKEFSCSNFKPSLSTQTYAREQAGNSTILNFAVPNIQNAGKYEILKDYKNTVKHESRCVPGYQMDSIISLGVASLNKYVPFIKDVLKPTEFVQNFDQGEFFKILNPQEENLDSFDVKFYTGYLNAYIKKVVAYRKIKDTVTQINLLNGDLTIKRVKILIRNLIPTIQVAYHEMLFLCAEGANKVFYYFHADRSGVSSQPVDDTWIRVTYLGYSNNCDSNNENWPENNPMNKDKDVSFLINKENADLELKEPEQIKYSSFNKFLRSVIDYSLMYPKYELDGYNCQHFATGFFNTFAGKDSNLFLEFFNVNQKKGKKVTYSAFFDSPVLFSKPKLSDKSAERKSTKIAKTKEEKHIPNAEIQSNTEVHNKEKTEEIQNEKPQLKEKKTKENEKENFQVQPTEQNKKKHNVSNEEKNE